MIVMTGTLAWVTDDGKSVLELDEAWYGITEMFISLSLPHDFKKGDRVYFDLIGGRKAPRLTAQPKSINSETLN